MPAAAATLRHTLDGMANTLPDPRVEAALDRMYTETKNQMSLLRERMDEFTRPMTAAERSEAMSEFYIPVTPDVRDNGVGRVITTELSASKNAAPKQTFAETGLDDVITILEGDALTTLQDLDGPVEFVLLDG